jgi:hypothetical protein
MSDQPNATVLLKLEPTESQADRLQERLARSGLTVSYQEEQHGAVLISFIRCTSTQEKAVRQILQELGVSESPPS